VSLFSRLKAVVAGDEYLDEDFDELDYVSEDEFNEIAIFYRTNNQSRLFEEELRKLSLNYKVVGNVRFYDRKEIKDILSYLNYLINPDDTVSFERVLNDK